MRTRTTNTAKAIAKLFTDRCAPTKSARERDGFCVRACVCAHACRPGERARAHADTHLNSLFCHQREHRATWSDVGIMCESFVSKDTNGRAHKPHTHTHSYCRCVMRDGRWSRVAKTTAGAADAARSRSNRLHTVRVPRELWPEH